MDLHFVCLSQDFALTREAVFVHGTEISCLIDIDSQVVDVRSWGGGIIFIKTGYPVYSGSYMYLDLGYQCSVTLRAVSRDVVQRKPLPLISNKQEFILSDSATYG